MEGSIDAGAGGGTATSAGAGAGAPPPWATKTLDLSPPIPNARHWMKFDATKNATRRREGLAAVLQSDMILSRTLFG